MSFKFEKLMIWQAAMDLGEEINTITLSFPKEEMYNVTSQIIRATDSIALNSSEGSIEQANAEFNRYLGYSVQSLEEVVTCLHKSKRRNYIEEIEFNKKYERAFNLMNMLIAFKNKVKNAN